MRKSRVDSVRGLKAKPFGQFGVKLLKTPKGWPVSIFYENIYRNGRNTTWVIHKKTAEFVYVLSGAARACLGNKVFTVKPGDYLLVLPGTRHRFLTGKKPMTALSLFCPPMGCGKPDAVLVKGPGR